VRILGVDCGTVVTGYGVIESDGARHRLLAAGTIRTNTKEPFEQRLLRIGRGLREVIAAQVPDAAAVEATFHAENARSALKLTHARGVALFVLAEAGLAVAEYSPLEVKAGVVGFGQASKEQVQFMIPSLLGLKEAPASPDACDALAVAICHATRACGAGARR
jgi:crossover junction endodeoxyribonuclease RuvC